MAADAEPNRDGRSAARYEVELEGTVRAADWRPIDVQLEDLSATGCRLMGATGVRVGDHLTIGVLGAGMRSARVVRQSDGKLGCEFAHRLEPAELETALARPAFVVVSLASAAPLTAAGPWQEDPAPDRGRFGISTRVAAMAAASLGLWTLIAVAVRLVRGG